MVSAAVPAASEDARDKTEDMVDGATAHLESFLFFSNRRARRQ
jgi:hypothetical protein